MTEYSPTSPSAHDAAPRRRFRAGWMAAALITLTALLVGCQVEEGEIVSEGTPPPGDVSVEVRLDEFSIEMPESINAGTVSFEISNVGEMEHSFAIEGAGLDEVLEEPIAPGESFTFTIELATGEYAVWCPIGEHRARGMAAIFEVLDEPGESEEAPLEDDAVEPSQSQEPIDEY